MSGITGKEQSSRIMLYSVSQLGAFTWSVPVFFIQILTNRQNTDKYERTLNARHKQTHSPEVG